MRADYGHAGGMQRDAAGSPPMPIPYVHTLCPHPMSVLQRRTDRACAALASGVSEANVAQFAAQ
eukprot:1626725-Rhodomonas_salina.1